MNPPAWERFYPCQHKPQNSEPYIPIVRSEKVGIFTYKLHPSRGPLLVFGWNWNYDVWQNDSTQLIGLEGIIRFIRTHLLHLVVVVFLGLAEFVCGTWLPCKEDHLWLFLMRTIFMLLIATSFAWKPRNRLMNDITFFFGVFLATTAAPWWKVWQQGATIKSSLQDIISRIVCSRVKH